MKKILTLLKLTVTAVTVTVVMSSYIPVCPPPGWGGTTLFPNPEDCSQYFQCDNGIPVLISCPPDLYFCPQQEACAWAWDPGCTFNCVMGFGRRICAWQGPGANSARVLDCQVCVTRVVTSRGGAGLCP